MQFELVNPLAHNKRISTKTDDPDQAAMNIWNKLNKYTKGYVNGSYFTIQDGGGKLHHYNVSEKINNNKVGFTISRTDDVKNEFEFLKHVNEKKGGGKHYSSSSSDSSDSSSDSSDDLTFKFKSKSKNNYLSTQPFVAYPSLYYTEVLDYCPWLYNSNEYIILPNFKSSFASNVAIIPLFVP
jgi:hypothetical protein